MNGSAALSLIPPSSSSACNCPPSCAYPSGTCSCPAPPPCDSCIESIFSLQPPLIPQDSLPLSGRTLLVFGCGKVGTALIIEALKQNIKVKCFLMHPAEVVVEHPNLFIIQGSVQNVAEVTAAITPDVDSIVSCVGGPTGFFSSYPAGMMIDFVRVVVREMRRLKTVRKLIFVAGAFSPTPEGGNSLLTKIRRATTWKLAGWSPLLQDNDKVIQFLYDEGGSLDFVVARPCETVSRHEWPSLHLRLGKADPQIDGSTAKDCPASCSSRGAPPDADGEGEEVAPPGGGIQENAIHEPKFSAKIYSDDLGRWIVAKVLCDTSAIPDFDARFPYLSY